MPLGRLEPDQWHIDLVSAGIPRYGWDNSGCPGTIDSDSCSGIKQPAWAFSHLLERFTR